MRILIVDDSIVFRSQIKAALDGIDGITVVGVAANGKIALDKLEQTAVDVVTLDLEMPEMNGMQMLAEMRLRGFKQHVIVFAAPTGSGIELALAALRAGAKDFVEKPASATSLEQALEGIKAELIPKILQFVKKSPPPPHQAARSAGPAPQSASPSGPTAAAPRQKSLAGVKPRIIGIGSSTGGPTALDSIFAQLRGKRLSIPIVIAQHMPPLFTDYLAKRLADVSGHPAREGRHGEFIEAGTIYVAPGDYHMTLERGLDQSRTMIRLDQGPKRNSVRPAVDSLFESMVRLYGATAAVFVLTGMGEDGLLGARAVKEATGTVVIQDKDSSVVWGMPGAVHAAGVYDAVGNLNECAKLLLQMTS